MYKLLSYSHSGLLSKLKNLYNPDSRFILPKQFLVSNEYMSQNLRDKLEAIPITTESKTHSIAILVGESHILSILPFLAKHCSLVIMNDIDPDVLSCAENFLDLLKKSQSRDDFITRYYQCPMNFPHAFKKDLIDHISCTAEDSIFQQDVKAFDNGTLPNEDIWFKKLLLTTDKALTDDFHFLSSESRFNQCKQVANNMHFCYTTVNLCDPQQVDTLSQYLRDFSTHISVFNISNVGNYCDLPQFALSSKLPFSTHPTILCSSMYFDRSVLLDTSNLEKQKITGIYMLVRHDLKGFTISGVYPSSAEIPELLELILHNVHVSYDIDKALAILRRILNSSDITERADSRQLFLSTCLKNNADPCFIDRTLNYACNPRLAFEMALMPIPSDNPLAHRYREHAIESLLLQNASTKCTLMEGNSRYYLIHLIAHENISQTAKQQVFTFIQQTAHYSEQALQNKIQESLYFGSEGYRTYYSLPPIWGEQHFLHLLYKN